MLAQMWRNSHAEAFYITFCILSIACRLVFNLTLFWLSGASVVLMVNNLGGLSYLELSVVAGSAVRCLGKFLLLEYWLSEIV